MAERKPGFDTLALHAGTAPDPATGARITPIYQTTAYVFNDVQHASDLFALRAFGNIYTRIMNPTQGALEGKVTALEGGTASLAVASGHAAQLLAFHTIMQPGDEFVAARQLYGGSINQFSHSFKSFGWHVVWADGDDVSSFEAAISPKTKAIFIESISNPGGRVTDIAAVAKIAQRAGIPLIVDNTLATPYLCRPLEYGANIVIHSLTKFMAGTATPWAASSSTAAISTGRNPAVIRCCRNPMIPTMASSCMRPSATSLRNRRTCTWIERSGPVHCAA